MCQSIVVRVRVDKYCRLSNNYLIVYLSSLSFHLAFEANHQVIKQAHEKKSVQKEHKNGSQFFGWYCVKIKLKLLRFFFVVETIDSASFIRQLKTLYKLNNHTKFFRFFFSRFKTNNWWSKSRPSAQTEENGHFYLTTMRSNQFRFKRTFRWWNKKSIIVQKSTAEITTNL